MTLPKWLKEEFNDYVLWMSLIRVEFVKCFANFYYPRKILETFRVML